MFFNSNKKVEGEIAYFKLQKWWLNSLSKEERRIILSIYKPLSTGQVSLTKGKIYSTTQTSIGFLTGLSSWFKKPEYRTIGYKIIKKAEELISKNSKILDLHFLYYSKILTYYRNRDNDNFALPKAIEACEQQISISVEAKRSFIKNIGEQLPIHTGYKQLCIIMEKQKNYEEVIRLSKIAKKQGWNGDWDKRILKCEKRIETKHKK